MSNKFGNKRKRIDNSHNISEKSTDNAMPSENLEPSIEGVLNEKNIISELQKNSLLEKNKYEAEKKALLKKLEKLELNDKSKTGTSLVDFIDIDADKKEFIPEKQVNFRLPLHLYKELDETKPQKMSITKFYRKLTIFYLEQKKQGSISF